MKQFAALTLALLAWSWIRMRILMRFWRAHPLALGLAIAFASFGSVLVWSITTIDLADPWSCATRDILAGVSAGWCAILVGRLVRDSYRVAVRHCQQQDFVSNHQEGEAP